MNPNTSFSLPPQPGASQSNEPPRAVVSSTMLPGQERRQVKGLLLKLGAGTAVLALLVGGYVLITHRQAQLTVTNNTKTAANTSTPSSTSAVTKDSSASVSPQATTPSTPSAGGTTPSSSCGVAGMPAGVCTAARAIEANGAKNNPYFVADSSQVPDGTKINFDMSSWQQQTTSQGVLNFTAVAGTKTYQGQGIFQTDGTNWGVTGYTLQ